MKLLLMIPGSHVSNLPDNCMYFSCPGNSHTYMNVIAIHVNRMGSVPTGVVIFKHLCIAIGEGRRMSTNGNYMAIPGKLIIISFL